LRAGLVLYNSGTKEEIRAVIKDFKKNETIDILFVYNMLLTGFDAPRLKRLYFCRKMDGHNLLQAITRVNRPYGEMRYGYVIDFANIKKNFEQTNEAYLQELAKHDDTSMPDGQSLVDTFHSVMAGNDEIVENMREIRKKLFDFSLDNAETFSTQIGTLEDKSALIDLKNALLSARDMGNMVRTFGDEEMRQKFEQIDIARLPELISEVQHRINLINAKEGFEVAADKKILINEAMASIEFTFSKIGEEELEIASRDELQSTYARLIHDFTTFDDQADEEFISLRDAFIQRFHEYGFEIDTVAKFNEQKKMLDEIMERLHKLQIANRALAEHYNGDAKYARIHKRIREENQRRQRHQNAHLIAKADDLVIEQVLKCIKAGIDEVVYDDYHILKKDAYFRQTVQHIIGTYTSSVINLGATKEDWEFMTPRIYQQYVEQYDRTYSAA
jgi:type I restriction enzyme R subunit